ncbi:porin family protein [Seonamhaeicola aphaedonensis]|uniref:Outer membrane protein with beta-barrel domain n=1 Tax=Seonamhaeicola aphaedonensis TaxID=1461338 RepID=A0A3D9HNQ2_9FLAO|nr:porin family protein [Seonamhaeicola aphaedonensis]RED50526.1 outer membrane protein with beta-barrel domain [Seonamhaeicola aphaedonensis]
MKYFVLIMLCFLSIEQIVAQQYVEVEADSLYKEDQFYAGVTYNLLGEKLDGLKQSGFSLGFQLGFIKDMPINKRRNVAFGLGLGYSANSFNQNLLINRGSNGLVYSILDNETFSKNKFSNHLIEVPFEFRWRSSTPLNYSFWRIYTGFKVSYVVAHTTIYKGDLGTIKLRDIEDFNKFQYGLTLSLGYDTWNIYMYYALNSIFSDNVTINGEQLNMNTIKIGLMFYIL